MRRMNYGAVGVTNSNQGVITNSLSAPITAETTDVTPPPQSTYGGRRFYADTLILCVHFIPIRVILFSTSTTQHSTVLCCTTYGT